MKHILIPIDFSNQSEQALASAFEIARFTGAQLLVAHIIEEEKPSEIAVSGDTERKDSKFAEYRVFIMQLISRKQKDLHRLVNKYRDNEVEVKYSIELGGFQEGMKDILDANPVDLIIMGSSGEKSAVEFFKGNHTAQVIRMADVPVLALQDQVHVSQLNKIMILVDLKEYNKKAVANIRKFAEAFEMRVIIAHITETFEPVETSIYSKLQKFAKENDFQAYSLHVIGHGEKVEKVKDFISEWDIHLVASISRISNVFARLFFGSDTEKFVNELDAHVLATHQ